LTVEIKKIGVTERLLFALFYYGALAFCIYLFFPVSWHEPLFWIGALVQIGLAYSTVSIRTISRKSLEIVIISVAILVPFIYAVVIKDNTLARSIIAVYMIAALIFAKYNYYRYGHWFKSDSDAEIMEKFGRFVSPEHLPSQFREQAKYVYAKKGHRVAEIVCQHEKNDAYYFGGEIRIKETRESIPSVKQKKSLEFTPEDINGVSVTIRQKKNWRSRIGENHPTEANWSYKNINFNLEAWKVPLEEVKKIIESMIKL